MSRKSDDRRQHPRVEARLAMQLAEETLGENLVTAESLNISRGGVYCESPEYLAPLSKVALTVVLPAFGPGSQSQVVRVEGVVVRCEPLQTLTGRKRYQLACCFTGLDTTTRGLLDQFIAWRALGGARAARKARAAAAAKKAVRAAKVTKLKKVAKVVKAAKVAKIPKVAKPVRKKAAAPARKATKAAKTAKAAKPARPGKAAKAARPKKAAKARTAARTRR